MGKDRKSERAASGTAAVKRKLQEPATPAGPKVFQIFFEDFHRELLDPSFVPLNNSGSRSEFLEFELFNRLSLSDHVAGAPLWGALSWRFTEKTGLMGADLLDIIAANPGYDVYYCNPYPKHESLFHNLWLQGETSHPDFAELARKFHVAAGFSADEVDLVWPAHVYSSANYFVGTPHFWESYLSFMNDALARAEQSLDQATLKKLHSLDADDRNLHAGQSYMPFIVERLFPLFLRTHNQTIKGYQIRLPLMEKDLDVHLKMLSQMKQVAHETKSAWLIACWSNYRSLYFRQMHGEAWTRKYLRKISPQNIRFA